MKTKILLAVGAVLLVLFLAGCTIEYQTKINPDQSGTVTEAIGMTADEVTYLTSQGGVDPKGVCDDLMKDSKSSLPSGAVTRQEKKGDETWCYVDVKFTSLADLGSFYTDQSNVTVNRLEVADNTFYYDVSTDTSAATGTTTGFPLQFTWKVTMPGAVKSNNATSVSGKTLTWDRGSATGKVDMQAQSSLAGSSLPGWAGWVIGGGACLCLLVLVIVVVVVVVLLLRKRNKKAAAPASPAEPAPPA
jgi:hypothetical protein